jgi:cell division protein FtsL
MVMTEAIAKIKYRINPGLERQILYVKRMIKHLTNQIEETNTRLTNFKEELKELELEAISRGIYD